MYQASSCGLLTAMASTSHAPRRRQDGRPAIGDRFDRAFPFVVAGVLVLVLTGAGVAVLGLLWSTSPDGVWVPVYQDIIQAAYQALGIGALGGLAKVAIDRRRDAERDAERRSERDATEAEDLRARRHSYIQQVVMASHDIDAARMRIQANKSVRTWTDAITDVLIPARSRMRVVKHELQNWREANAPVFGPDAGVEEKLNELAAYLGDLMWEHAKHKRDLGELQREAERQYGSERQEAIEEIWEALEALPVLGGFVASESGTYGSFRALYVDVLTEMRTALGSTPEQRPITTPQA